MTHVTILMVLCCIYLPTEIKTAQQVKSFQFSMLGGKNLMYIKCLQNSKHFARQFTVFQTVIIIK